MSINWNYPTPIAVGAGRLQELPTVCAELGITAPLLVTDPGLAALPLITETLQQCRDAGLQIALFSDIKPNPTGANVAAGQQRYIEGGHDGVIAMGGGSGLDAGKAIALMAHQTCELWDIEDIGDNWLRANAELIAPVIAVPTTAGTGSEVGRAALIIDEAQQRKVIVFHPAMLPARVILDAQVTLGLPAHLTAATGMDALSHNLEAYCSRHFHPMAEGIAVEGIRRIKTALPRVFADGSDLAAREEMLVASTMGATAFQKGLGAMHALAHPLGAVFDAHHGMLNAVLMPYVLAANRPAIEDNIIRLARYLALPPSFEGFMEWILALRAELQIPHRLDAVITEVKGGTPMSAIGAMAVRDPSAGSNPIDFSAADYQRILDAALKGDV